MNHGSLMEGPLSTVGGEGGGCAISPSLSYSDKDIGSSSDNDSLNFGSDSGSDS